ncbi:unnamed protein product [Cylindrotheca closterium]|uniref:Calcineurin-like phosphoesterase domain-containing protein n=1 Tax=Cylindrotheca closterium TaxID=2856 RepID=A0AAD2JIB0_9STRA|nr:unnamed protein product [Cylindrotheca closterium]
MSSSFIFSLFLATLVFTNERMIHASSAVSVAPDLPLGEINVLVLTDVHSWLAGHGRQEENLNADYGDVLSFYENLKTYCDENDQDLWFVSNGDFVDGTGLSIPGDPSSLVPVLQKMPLDALTCGNHELYIDDTVDYMVRPGGWADWWGEKYLTGNIQVTANGEIQQLGHLYRYLKGKHSNLLVYGFLYNMEGACESITVEKVDDVVKMSWFKEALTREDESIDAILVLAHMDLKDPLVTVIRKAIREIVGDSMPIQFITGHTHYRGEIELDDWSHSFEAGRYLDTIGFVSLPTKATAMATPPSTTDGPVENGFKHVFIDANKAILAGHLGIKDPKDMNTEHGLELSEFAHRTRQKMGLLDQIGCAPHDFKARAPLDDPKSLWGLYKREVLPKIFFKEESDGIMFVENEAWRYDLFSQSPLVVDDIMAVAPFNDTIVFIGEVAGSAILELNVSLNERKGSLPHYILAGEIDNKDKLYDMYTHDFNVKEVVNALKKTVPDQEYEPKTTETTSTLIWLAFVRENWPCHGELGKDAPPIASPPATLSSYIFQDDDGIATESCPTIMLMMGLLLMTILLYCAFGCTKSTSTEFVLLDPKEDCMEAQFEDRVEK